MKLHSKTEKEKVMMHGGTSNNATEPKGSVTITSPC